MNFQNSAGVLTGAGSGQGSGREPVNDVVDKRHHHSKDQRKLLR